MVENLKAKLLIEMDAMGHEVFRLNSDSKTVKTTSCMGLTVPISMHANIHHAPQRAVYTAAHVTHVPARVRAPLR